jgi:hypothetical protein
MIHPCLHAQDELKKAISMNQQIKGVIVDMRTELQGVKNSLAEVGQSRQFRTYYAWPDCLCVLCSRELKIPA